MTGSERLLWGLLYESTATVPLSADELRELLDQAQSRNSDLLVTGWLTYAPGAGGTAGVFTQYIEGPRHAVRRLFYGEGSAYHAPGKGIIDDPRHTDVEVIQEGAFGGGPPGCRLYPGWTMNFVAAPGGPQAEAPV